MTTRLGNSRRPRFTGVISFSDSDMDRLSMQGTGRNQMVAIDARAGPRRVGTAHLLN